MRRKIGLTGLQRFSFEDAITLTTVAREGLIPSNRSGKPASHRSVLLYAKSGWRPASSHGGPTLVLPTVLIAGTTYTTRQWVARFVEARQKLQEAFAESCRLRRERDELIANANRVLFAERRRKSIQKKVLDFLERVQKKPLTSEN